MRTFTLKLATLLLLGTTLPLAHADTTPAAARYEADKKLCAEESSSSLRLQCLRDARAEYEKATANSTASTANKTSKTTCPECGKVLSVKQEEKEGQGGAVGMIAGGLAGALLGNQVGAGNGRTVATIAGAAGGAYAGKKVEENMKSSKVWVVRVQLNSGEEKSFTLDHDPGFAAGDLVKVNGDTLSRR